MSASCHKLLEAQLLYMRKMSQKHSLTLLRPYLRCSLRFSDLEFDKEVISDGYLANFCVFRVGGDFK